MTTRRESRGAQLARIIEGERGDVRERTEALRLQARAWRLLAIIATHDPAYGARKAAWLMFVSVPVVDGPAVERFIESHEAMAADYGRRSGVFTDPPAPRRS